MNKIIYFLVISIFVSSCSVKMEEQEIHDMVFGYDRGIVVGVQIGDSWDSVKDNVRPGWTVREETGIHQFRKDWDVGNDMMMVTFELGSNKQVVGMEFSATAMPTNYEQLDLLRKKFQSDFNLITISKELSNWDYSGPNGEKYTLSVSEPETSSERKSFYVRVKKDV